MNERSRRLTDQQKVRIIQNAREQNSEIHRKHLEETADARLHYAQAEQPVVEALRLTGYEVNHIQELYQKYKTYKSAIPILLKWLPKIAHSDPVAVMQVKQTVLHALNNKCAKPEAIRPLIEEFENFKYVEGVNDYMNGSYRWKIGEILALIGDSSVADDLFRFIKNRAYGSDRAQLVRGIKNLKDPRAVDVLINLVIDNDLTECAIYALGMLRAKKARPYIEKFLKDSTASVRQEAKAAIKRIDKE